MNGRQASRGIVAAAVAVAAWSGAMAQPVNDACDAPTAIAGFASVAFDTTGATTDGVSSPSCLFFSQDQIFNDTWYCWTAQVSGPTKMRTCTATYDTKLAVYAGCSPCPEAGGILVCNDDSCGTRSELDFVATAGQQYMVRLGSYAADATGTGTLEILSGLTPVLGGPIVNPANGHTYYLLERTPWTVGEATAVSMGGHLVTINDAAENEWVRENLGNFGGTGRRLWLGYNDIASEGTFVWTSGETPGFTNWSGGEPNDSGGVEDYTEMFGSNGLWNDNSVNPTAVVVYGTVEIGTPSCPPDWDHNGVVEPVDIAAFINDWFTSVSFGGVAGDWDNNGVVEPADIAGFINAWFNAVQNGC
ncbi:MAG: hypothetical protein KF745_07045 [Phycisphaeraceae bacterium]|nr:hypothetical protein [Phycisphaeraceae bacterium]